MRWITRRGHRAWRRHAIEPYTQLRVRITDKVQRAKTLAADLSNQRVFLPRGLGIEEIPGRADDRVDVLLCAFHDLRR